MGVQKNNKMLWLMTKNMLLCPKCKQPVFNHDNNDYVICCGEVIIVVNHLKLDDENVMKIAFDSIKDSLIRDLPV